MAELRCENNTSNRDISVKKVFLYLPIKTFVWSPAVAFMEIKDL